MPNTFYPQTHCWVWDFVAWIIADRKKDISPLTQCFYLFPKSFSVSMFAVAALERSKSKEFVLKEKIQEESGRWICFEDDDPKAKFFGLTQTECRDIIDSNSAVKNLRKFLTVDVLSNGDCLKLTHPKSKNSAFWFFGRDVYRRELPKITVASNDECFSSLVGHQEGVTTYVFKELGLPFDVNSP